MEIRICETPTKLGEQAANPRKAIVEKGESCFLFSSGAS